MAKEWTHRLREEHRVSSEITVHLWTEFTNMSNIFLTQAQGNSMKKGVSTNGVGAIGHPYAKQCTLINSSHFI